MTRFVQGTVLKSPVSKRRYELSHVIGHGGYGKAFEALDIKAKKRVCLKYTLDQTSWHRESYFGELLKGNKRVIQIYDSFPLMPTRPARIRYCLVLELAEHGAVAVA